MPRDEERIGWIAAALDEAGLDGLICAYPQNVLLLSGYFPVVGTSLGVARRDGRIGVLVPEDEEVLARTGWADQVHTYAPASLRDMSGPLENVVAPLQELLDELGIAQARLGYEDHPLYEGSSYAAIFLFGATLGPSLERAAAQAQLTSGSAPIAQLRSRLTGYEVGKVRRACAAAAEPFASLVGKIRPGQREPDVAGTLATSLLAETLAQPGTQRADAFTWCMSGPNSAEAGAAYALTGTRELQNGDLVLVHCNTHLDGYWTDITRTFCLGEPGERQLAMYEAVLAARAAALAAIRPGAAACEVDRAARAVLVDRGFGRYFTHGVGHSLGFSVISTIFPPRLHPASPDRLVAGMTFNIEPAIYIKGYGGLRHCDVVTVQEDGPEVLTPFLSQTEELILPG